MMVNNGLQRKTEALKRMLRHSRVASPPPSKRVAASGYGIGRYLYNLDTTFAECSATFQKGYTKALTKDKKVLYWKAPSSLPCKTKIESCNTLTELKKMWSTFSNEQKKQNEDVKDLRKIQIEREIKQ
jgi:hypothetical protein